MSTLQLLLAWIGAWSVASFALAGFDKARARAGKGRVPERTLLGSALLGGSPGLLLGMLVFRHKTRKLAFLLPFALILLAQGAAAWWALNR